MSRVLLLNPPGEKNYIRDYFCSKIAKSRYNFPPVALLMLTGVLEEAGHELQVLDAIVENRTPAESLERIVEYSPDVIITLVGAASWEEDRAFLTAVKKKVPDAYLVANGDILLEETEARLADVPAIDAALNHFISPGVLDLLNRRDGRPIPGAVYRSPRGGGFVNGGFARHRADYHVPRPRHDRFPLRRYRFPFMVAHPMTAMLTDYGCPFPCAFCVMPGLGFGVRPAGDVIEELECLHRLRVREIFFQDQTFGARRGRTLEILNAMIRNKWRFRWSCMTRADVLDDEMLTTMREAGCHTLIIGVESGSDRVLEEYRKKTNLNTIAASLDLTRRRGIRVAATFLLGLPGETEAEARRTIDLALTLPIDYVSFNVAIPRAATPLREQAIRDGLIAEDVHVMDQSGMESAMSTREMPAERIMALRREAVRRFYLRPGFLLRRVLTLRSWWDLKTQFADGLSVIADALGRTRRSR